MTARGERWRVSHADQYPECVLVTLDGVESANDGVRVTLIAPFDTIATVAVKTPRRRKRDRTLRAALATIAGARPARGMWTVAGARVDLLAYQLEPALAVLGFAIIGRCMFDPFLGCNNSNSPTTKTRYRWPASEY